MDSNFFFRSVSRSVGQPVGGLVSRSVGQPVNMSVSQAISQLVCTCLSPCLSLFTCMCVVRVCKCAFVHARECVCVCVCVSTSTSTCDVSLSYDDVRMTLADKLVCSKHKIAADVTVRGSFVH